MRLWGALREAQSEPQVEQLWVQFSDISTSPKFLILLYYYIPYPKDVNLNPLFTQLDRWCIISSNERWMENGFS